MGMISVRVDEEHKQEMDSHPEINWSAVTRQAIDEKLAALERLERMDELAARSEASREDAAEIADSINSGLSQRHEPEYSDSSAK